MKKYILFSIIVLAALWVLSSKVVYAANWYVDNAATGSNNGTSWANAWQAFANISWGSIAPGDTIYISGGTTSKTYNERLAVGASGTSGNPITIKTGQDAGHNGTVIITTTASPWMGITVASRQHITISGQVGSGSDRKMRLTGSSISGFYASGTTNAIKLLYLEVDNNGTVANHNGVQATITVGASGWEIAYCYVHDNYQDALGLGNTNVDRSGYGINSIHHNILSAHDDTIEMSFAGVEKARVKDRLNWRK